MAKKAWGEARLSPLEILLDRQNPRINVASADVENDIIKKLLKYEEVTDLAKKLAKGGLLPGERPIVVKENGQYIVLEGNRRICASKLLLNRELIPPEYRRGFPTITTADQLELLKKIKVDVSPDRRTAEPILTLRHTESGIKRWKWPQAVPILIFDAPASTTGSCDRVPSSSMDVELRQPQDRPGTVQLRAYLDGQHVSRNSRIEVRG